MGIVTLLAAGACGPSGDGGGAEGTAEPAATAEEAGSTAGTVEAELWLDEVHVGTEVDPEGAIPIARRADEFAPGDRLYVSMDVADAPPFTAVHVVFRNGAGETVAEDEKKVSAEARHLYFDAGDTAHWPPGPYRVVVAVNGEPAAEREVTLVGHSQEPDSEPG